MVCLGSRLPHTSFSGGGLVMWLGLALSYFLLCPASELFSYANGLVHPDFYLKRDCITFFSGHVQVSVEDRARADSVSRFFFGRPKRTRRAEVIRSRGCAGKRRVEMGGCRSGRSRHWWSSSTPIRDFPKTPPTVITRVEAVVALRTMVASTGREP